MTTQNQSPTNKRATRKPLREKYAHLSKRGRPRSEAGQALLDFAAEYPCHIVTAQKVYRGVLESPAICAAWRDFATRRGVPVRRGETPQVATHATA